MSNKASFFSRITAVQDSIADDIYPAHCAAECNCGDCIDVHESVSVQDRAAFVANWYSAGGGVALYWPYVL